MKNIRTNRARFTNSIVFPPTVVSAAAREAALDAMAKFSRAETDLATPSFLRTQTDTEIHAGVLQAQAVASRLSTAADRL